MEEEKQTQEEIDNDNAIPKDLKEQITEKANAITKNISIIEKAVTNTVESTVMDMETVVTVNEVMAALMNVLKKLNQQCLMKQIN